MNIGRAESKKSPAPGLKMTGAWDLFRKLAHEHGRHASEKYLDQNSGSSVIKKMPLAQEHVLTRYSVRCAYPPHIADVAYIDPPDFMGCDACYVNKVVVLLHGYGSHGEGWSTDFIAALLSAGCRVVIPTYSDAFESIVGASANVLQVCKDAVAIRVREGNTETKTPKVIVVGHSMGGMIAQEMAYVVESRRCPQEVNIHGFLLIATSIPVFSTVHGENFPSAYSDAQKITTKTLQPASAALIGRILASARRAYSEKQGACHGTPCETLTPRDRQVEADTTALLTSVHEVLNDARVLCTLPFKVAIGTAKDEASTHANLRRDAIASIDAMQQLLPHSFKELLAETKVERLYRNMRLHSSVLSQHAHVRNIAQFNAVMSWANASHTNHFVRDALPLRVGSPARSVKYATVFGANDPLFPPRHMEPLVYSLGRDAPVSTYVCPHSNHSMAKIFEFQTRHSNKAHPTACTPLSDYISTKEVFASLLSRPMSNGMKFVISFICEV